MENPMLILNRFSTLVQPFTIFLASMLLAACAAGSTGLLRPNGVVVAPDGSLYVMDRGNYRVVHLSATGKWLAAFGQLGTEPGDIYSGWDIDLDAAGNIYICNQIRAEEGASHFRDGIDIFSPAGQYWRTFGEQTYAYDDEHINSPYGLDIDDQGRVYVADFDAAAVRVFSAQGELLARLDGEANQFDDPVDVAVDDRRQFLYIADPYQSQVHRFGLSQSETGELTATHQLSLGGYGREPGQFAYLQNLVVDDLNGRLYVSDVANHRIQIFDSEGQYLTELAAPGTWQVLGLDIGSDGAVYAADAFNNAIWIFESDGRVRQRVEVQP
jgi:DNA-binding beta-propeller fold protein YncE